MHTTTIYLGTSSQPVPVSHLTTAASQILIRPNIKPTVRSHSQVAYIQITMLHRRAGKAQFMQAIRQGLMSKAITRKEHPEPKVNFFCLHPIILKMDH